MRIAIDTKSPVPLHAQIAEKIHMAIATGELQPGEQLPTVRQLSVDLKVNSNTVARVYGELERTGYLETRRGRGTFVASRVPKGKAAAGTGVRQRRLASLCSSFVRICVDEGFSLDEIGETLRALTGKGERQ